MLTPEQQLFYDDLLDSGLVTTNFINKMIEDAHIAEYLNPRGTETELLTADEQHFANFHYYSDTNPPHVVITFAGCVLDLPVPTLVKDIQTTQTNQ